MTLLSPPLMTFVLLCLLFILIFSPLPWLTLTSRLIPWRTCHPLSLMISPLFERVISLWMRFCLLSVGWPDLRPTCPPGWQRSSLLWLFLSSGLASVSLSLALSRSSPLFLVVFCCQCSVQGVGSSWPVGEEVRLLLPWLVLTQVFLVFVFSWCFAVCCLFQAFFLRLQGFADVLKLSPSGLAWPERFVCHVLQFSCLWFVLSPCLLPCG